MPFEPTRASVLTEGCDLHYWYQGSGPLLVFIPGGGGIGRQFNPFSSIWTNISLYVPMIDDKPTTAV